MEKSILQQKLEIAADNFPVGMKVFNLKIGSVGKISGKPLIDETECKVLLPVAYDGKECLDIPDNICDASSVKKAGGRDI